VPLAFHFHGGWQDQGYQHFCASIWSKIFFGLARQVELVVGLQPKQPVQPEANNF
jgi:hypothetical protein